MQCYICHSNQFCASIFYITINSAHSWPGSLRPWDFMNPDTPIALLFLLHMHWVSVKPSEQNWDSLWVPMLLQGLSRMKRTHIHFATGLPGESGVISGVFCEEVVLRWLNVNVNFLFFFTGMRSSCQVLIFINLKKALEGVMCRSTEWICSSYCYAKLTTATDKSGPFLYLKVLWIEGGARACMHACDRGRRVDLNTGLR